MIKLFYIISVGFIFVGCNTHNQTIDIKEKPRLQIPKKTATIIRKKGSLYTRRGPSLFSDKKDLQIGDIIQIIVDEGLSNSSKDTIDSSKTSTTGIDGGLISTPHSGPRVTKITNRLNSLTSIGFSANTNNSFKGDVSATADETFTTTISAVITQTYQNGNYFIEGSKQMLINGQKQLIQISGLIRPYDISPDNTINSSQLANLKILYNKAGYQQDSLDKPWGSEIIENLSPF